ncbi:unnamed protein product (macronuclear) [Paramecium tetraurelia]|uniref:PDZ domain-containing protein n=1 Tax=Paramecium tetraurelia TaxID=5888 RepID=A0DTZ9_PARTE|nr:uncharacterized protein GSPATT00020200001 [Paramecium tetraurelia]CAK86516.1 unnamed protein product [Paramecium tetraurelia]|eukprot:XP_001453913.1 hypothetical protein (macronuclear) [Paramecium tetraurelia strain d4-2]
MHSQIFLPISKQDTKQFQYWTKFKEIIDPINQTIEVSKIPIFFQSIQNPKSNQENQTSTTIQKLQLKNNLSAQDRICCINDNQIKPCEFEMKLKEISEKINKTFHQNNTHLEILLKMDDTTQDAKVKLEIGNQRTTSTTRRIDFKRRNTDYYSLKPINI